ncbi:MAG: hypothetical protein CSB47_06025 [Proteobacteria bacterium]|nr:MAG: hypothetical protein CSB47_06025 [Pseudomonadota bacterium]
MLSVNLSARLYYNRRGWVRVLVEAASLSNLLWWPCNLWLKAQYIPKWIYSRKALIAGVLGAFYP